MIRRTVAEWGRLAYGSGPEQIEETAAVRLAAVARALPLAGTDGSGILSLGRKELKAGQMVGVLAAQGCALEILPKIGELDEGGVRRQLVRMLAVTHDLDVSAGALSELDWQRDDLLEILIRLFARMLTEAVRRGMPRRYVGYEDDLPVLRGRLDPARQFTRLAASPQFLACRFDALSANISLNQIMKAAVLRLQSLARRAETRRTLTELAFAYADIREVPVEALRFDDVILDRTNARWRDLLALARLLLQGRFQTTSGGASTGFSLLFPMNALFETYVARMLARVLRGSGQRVVAQGGLLYCLEDPESGTRRFCTKPDILVKRDLETKLVIDTKWKRLAPIIDDPKQGVSQSDIYQMMAYGRLYCCTRLLLLYPHHAQLDAGPGLCSRHRVVSSHDELFVGTIDLSDINNVPGMLSNLVSSCYMNSEASREQH
ncbi:McrC family protein [Methylobacterium radiotolerans]|uniref:McrC family protein n=1 Tax=Methylobacterium radiotolerans TaxID=31998 RepID=UPI000975E0E5|nr:restriction endonuclease [Methylobacterium radiotolerans]ONF47812.1 McrBC 5-methylcytosine restriction system component [Methylobacterium radiotolerans]